MALTRALCHEHSTRTPSFSRSHWYVRPNAVCDIWCRWLFRTEASIISDDAISLRLTRLELTPVLNLLHAPSCLLAPQLPLTASYTPSRVIFRYCLRNQHGVLLPHRPPHAIPNPATHTAMINTSRAHCICRRRK